MHSIPAFHGGHRLDLPEKARLQPAEYFIRKQRGTLTTRAGFSSIRRMAKKITPIKDRLSKTQIVDQIAGDTELTRKQVAAVLDSLGDVIEAHVKKNAVGEFVLPGLLKISTVRKPAVKARKGINPFTKEEVMFKAKPATTVVKVRPLKKLKDMAI
jgi:nucleoid DNA-binding protein